MKRVLLFVALLALAVPAIANAQTPLLSFERVNVGVRVGHEWNYTSFSGSEFAKDWRAEIPISYTLPTAIPSSLSIKAGKFFGSSEVRYDVFFTVALVHQGQLLGGN